MPSLIKRGHISSFIHPQLCIGRYFQQNHNDGYIWQLCPSVVSCSCGSGMTSSEFKSATSTILLTCSK
ncbi:unnamed protein product [Mycena citricolor]|uniref:Uncharacterized protein n=1 Tax=Mycena citricolor TaxID=2018698 RepID=A0AAD2K7V4_9AGAR|nr:unnamed protein product [Mycena citricolor]CAK5284050.1 unnamed protein product [Mycena citricolor]